MSSKFKLFKTSDSENDVSNGFSISVYSVDKEREAVDLGHIKDGETVETICNTLGDKLDITPAFIHCFGLCIIDSNTLEYYWLPPGECLSHNIPIKDVHFRMRFRPNSEKVVKFHNIDEGCFKYLFYQVKWDFLHGNLSYQQKLAKNIQREDSVRGLVITLIIIILMIKSETNGQEVDIDKFLKKYPIKKHFLPPLLKEDKNFVEVTLLKNRIKRKAQELNNDYGYRQGTNQSVSFMKTFLNENLKCNASNDVEKYRLYECEHTMQGTESSTEGGFTIVTPTSLPELKSKQEMVVSVVFRGLNSCLKITHTPSGDNLMGAPGCVIALKDLSKVHFEQTEMQNEQWWKIDIIWTGGCPKVLYTDSKESCYSFISCISQYVLLMFDFYINLCDRPVLQSARVNQLNHTKAFAPSSKSHLMEMLQRKKPQCDKYYILCANSKQYGVFDVAHMTSYHDKLAVTSLNKIMKCEDGYMTDGLPPEKHIKALINKMIERDNLLPENCIKIIPHSQGCEVLQKLLEEGDTNHEEGNDDQESRLIKNQPKVYLQTSLVLTEFVGQGYFTDVYSGVLSSSSSSIFIYCRNKVNNKLNDTDPVVVKQLRNDPRIKPDFSELHQAFQAGMSRLIQLNDSRFFMQCMGMVLLDEGNIGMCLPDTSFPNLRTFLQCPHPGAPPLFLHHLIDVCIHLTDAVSYMEKENCFHGNISCNNVIVEQFDRHRILVKLADPGLVSLYNKLPLIHDINQKRLAWLAPETYTDLSMTNEKTEVWALGTTLWQMFARGKGPQEADPKLQNKTFHEIRGFFMSSEVLSCPEYLQVQGTDSFNIERIKKGFYEQLKTCWVTSTEDRPGSKRLLKSFHTCIQTNKQDYHEYDLYNFTQTDTSTIESELEESSVFESAVQFPSLPDLSCLNRANTRHDNHRQIGRVDEAGDPGHLDNERQLKARNTVALPATQHITSQSTHSNSVAINGTVEPSLTSQFTSSLLGSLSGQPLPPPPIVGFVIPRNRLVFNIKKSEKLGQGYYGEVYKARLLKNHPLFIDVVVKLLRDDKVDGFKEEFKKEADIMQTLNHRNIVKFYGTCDSQHGYCLVMDYVQNKSLINFVKSNPMVKLLVNKDFLQLALDIASGMDYLESMKIIHCDLAARNVLLTTERVAKIADFGLSKVIGGDTDYYRRQHLEKNIPIFWCAPEWLSTKVISSKSDVWSFAVVMWEMYSYGKDPKIGKDVNDFVVRINKGERFPQPEEQPVLCPDIVYKLMRQCWDMERDRRPSFKQCTERLGEMLASETKRDIKPVRVPQSHSNVIIQKGELIVDFERPDQQLGHGAFGVVYKGRYDNRDVAVKHCTNMTEYDRFKREFEILDQLTSKGSGHPNIVKFIGLRSVETDHDVQHSSSKYMYVMEYLSRGTLNEHLKKCKLDGQPETITNKLNYLIDVAKGMQFLFDNLVVHCDLTSLNILLDEHLVAKICDFGWSKVLGSLEDHYERQTTSCKPEWAAPEMLTTCILTKYTDIWSYGVLAMEVLMDGETPQMDPPATHDELYSRLKNGDRYPCPTACPDDVYAVVLACWDNNGEKRIRYKAIQEHFSSFIKTQSVTQA